MTWIAFLIANLTGAVVWQTIMNAFVSVVSWAFSKLPTEVQTFFERSYLGELVALLGSNGTPVGTMQQGVKFGYDLITYFLPVGELMVQWFVVLGVLGTIRLARWIIGFAPTIEG